MRETTQLRSEYALEARAGADPGHDVGRKLDTRRSGCLARWERMVRLDRAGHTLARRSADAHEALVGGRIRPRVIDNR
jgi:hypothetical protein